MATSAHAVILFSLILVEGFMLLRMKVYGYLPEMHVQMNTVSEDLAYRPYYTYAYCWRELPQTSFSSLTSTRERDALYLERLRNPKLTSQLAMMAVCYTIVLGEYFLLLAVIAVVIFCTSGSLPSVSFKWDDFVNTLGGVGGVSTLLGLK